MRRKLAHRSWSAFAALLPGCVFMLFPFIWMLLSAFKTKADVYAWPPRWIPATFELQNFQKVFDIIPFWKYYLNSIYTSVTQTFLQIVLSVTAAYALTKISFPGRRLFHRLLMSSLFVPAVVTMIPLYLIVASLGMVDTYAGIILPQIVTAFTTMLLMSFFESLPNDLIASANIDGCGYLRVLWYVIIPNAKGGIATAMLFSFLGNWKSYTWPLIVTNSTPLRTLPIGLKYLVQESSSEYQVMMAAALMAIVPVLLVFAFSEKQLVRSITLTGMK